MAPKHMNTRIVSKNTILFTITTEIFGEKINLALIKFFGLSICALCKYALGQLRIALKKRVLTLFINNYLKVR
jgi:hypothetical protein